MLQFGVLFLFASAFAKLEKPSYDYIFYEQFNRVEDLTFPARKSQGEAAWVLSLNEDMENLKLRLLRGDEVIEVFGSSKSGPTPRHRRVKKDDPTKEPIALETKQTALEKRAMISDIMRSINKFALSNNDESDAYISQDANEVYPSLKLYFQGERTSLVLRVEGRQWHYLLGPGLFPEWFYQERTGAADRGASVVVPSTVLMGFYSALKHLLTMLFTIAM